jgi:hypothetical protein
VAVVPAVVAMAAAAPVALTVEAVEALGAVVAMVEAVPVARPAAPAGMVTPVRRPALRRFSDGSPVRSARSQLSSSLLVREGLRPPVASRATPWITCSNVPAASPVNSDAPAFSAITPGGVLRPVSMYMATCPVFFHLLLGGDAGEVGYFRVPRALAGTDAPGPRGLPHINLDTGTIGVIDSIVQARGIASSVSVQVLAVAMVTDDPL